MKLALGLPPWLVPGVCAVLLPSRNKPPLTTSFHWRAGFCLHDAGLTGAPAAPMAAESKLDGKDRDFIEKCRAVRPYGSRRQQDGAREVPKPPEVKKFARGTDDRRPRQGGQKAALAKSKGVDVPTDPSLMQQAKLKTLGMRDDGFDEAHAEGWAVGP